MADNARGDEEDLRQWFQHHGLEPSSPSGRFDRRRWCTRAPSLRPLRIRFVVAAAAFCVVLTGGAVWLHGLRTVGAPTSAGRSRAATLCGVAAVKAAEAQYPPLANLPDGGQILYSTDMKPCFWEVSFTSKPPPRLLGALLVRGVRVSWTRGAPLPDRPTPIMPMSPILPGGNGNPISPSAGPS